MSANDSTWIENGITANFYIVTKHGTNLLKPCFDLFITIMDDNELFITLDIGCNGTCARMRIIAKNTIAYIVIMWCLNMVKENDILEFC